jgi:arsenite-transporting ATPase
VKDNYVKGWRESQTHYLEKAEEYFRPIPIFYVKLFQNEILGYNSLHSLAEQIYEGKDPLERFFKGEPYQLIKENGEYRLIMKLPFLAKGYVELNKLSDELIIRIGSFKRNMILPRHVASSKSVKAKLVGQHLSIIFKGEDHGQNN